MTLLSPVRELAHSIRTWLTRCRYCGERHGANLEAHIVTQHAGDDDLIPWRR